MSTLKPSGTTNFPSGLPKPGCRGGKTPPPSGAEALLHGLKSRRYRSGLSAHNVYASSPNPHRRVDAPPREQAGFSLLIRSPSPVRTGFRWALPVPGYGCPTPPPYQSAQVSGVAAPWAPGPGLPAFGRVGTSGRPRGGGLSPLPRHAHLTEASLGSPFPTRLRSSGRACGTRARAPRVPASPMGGRVAPLPLPLTRRAMRPPPGFRFRPPPSCRQEGDPPGWLRAPSRRPTPWRAAPCAEGTATRSPGRTPPCPRVGFSPTPNTASRRVSGAYAPSPTATLPASPFLQTPDPSGLSHWDRPGRLYRPEPPVECRASPHFWRHAASPATATCRHRRRLSGPGTTRVRASPMVGGRAPKAKKTARRVRNLIWFD